MEGSNNLREYGQPVRRSRRTQSFYWNREVPAIPSVCSGSGSSAVTKFSAKQARKVATLTGDACDEQRKKRRVKTGEQSGWHQGIKRINTNEKRPPICTNENIVDAVNFSSPEELIEKETIAVRCKGMVALATASSGVAAGLLPGGRTAHSRFKLPLQVSSKSTTSVSKQSSLAELLRMTQLIIWDEAPMLNKAVIESLNEMLQDITESKLPFGGKVVVFGGDFRQILPVVPNREKEDIVGATLVNSYLWPFIKKIKLVQNMRAQLDLPFSEYLLRIGNGIEPLHSCNMIKLPDEMIIPHDNETIPVQNLINVVFPELNTYVDNIEAMINRIILCPKNENVDFINAMLIEKFPGDSVKYYSFDEPVNLNARSFDEDFFNTLTPNGVPPHELILKKNCPIILLRNINPSEGLCNGTRLICKRFDRNIIDAEISVGQYKYKRVFLPRIPFVPFENDINPIRFKRTQFPIRVCFAMTINKAQGQTLDFVGLYLPEPVFSHGQLYVALSRAKNSACIKVLMKPSENKIVHCTCTKNIVYKEVLSAVSSS